MSNDPIELSKFNYLHVGNKVTYHGNDVVSYWRLIEGGIYCKIEQITDDNIKPLRKEVHCVDIKYVLMSVKQQMHELDITDFAFNFIDGKFLEIIGEAYVYEVVYYQNGRLVQRPLTHNEYIWLAIRGYDIGAIDKKYVILI